MRYAGDKPVIARFAGDKPVVRRYAGSAMVWEAIPPDPSLLVHMKFDGNIDDSSAYENSISLINAADASFVNGVKGEAIYMGAAATVANRAHIEIASNEALQAINEEWTIAYFIKTDRVASNIFSNHAGTGFRGIDITILSDGRSDLYLNRGITEEVDTLRSSGTSNNGQVDVNTFHHYAWVRSGTSMKCYYNFAQTNEKTIGELDVSTNSNWLINRRGTSRATAVYDDFRIYNRALSAQEIAGLNV